MGLPQVWIIPRTTKAGVVYVVQSKTIKDGHTLFETREYKTLADAVQHKLDVKFGKVVTKRKGGGKP